MPRYATILVGKTRRTRVGHRSSGKLFANAARALQHVARMIAPFPHHYVVTYEAGDLAAPPRAPIAAGAPPQFGGSDAMWSPEELLVGAALLCLKTTFDAYARRDKLQIFEWRGRGEGVLDKGREGPIFTDIALDVVLVTRPGDEARARAVLELAEHNCIISRALKTQVKLSIEVTARELREAQALAQ